MQKQQPELKRSLTVTHLVLYGLGVTIGAGIYVLIGATASKAGMYAPLAFVVAAFVMAFTASSFAELSGRYPVSAGEAAYIKAGLNSKTLSLLVGLGVASAGVVSAATISIGSAGYIQQFLNIPEYILIITVVALMGLVAIWGITESITLAGILTLIEIGGLLLIIFGGLGSDTSIITRIPEVMPPLLDFNIWQAVFAAGLLAFFAFIGFEDLVNVAEESKNPQRTMPVAIFLTLTISTLLYFLVAAISVLSVPINELGTSKAPLALVFSKTTGLPPLTMTIIAIIATVNGIIIQMIMASRVLYGLARQGSLPAILGDVHPVTRTPVNSTLLVAIIILILALLFPKNNLAEATSAITLVVFSLVNLALLSIKLRSDKAPEGTFIVWTWVPGAGFIISLIFLTAKFI